ncbi:hypothetical protein FAI41_03900 [Acetobacteraceae bacterium]|nr:hypothetical protein FAI41_03900 [Acetobacteraceae bacterium]
MFSWRQKVALSEFKRSHAYMLFGLAVLQKCAITLAQTESMINGTVPLYLKTEDAEIMINLMRGYHFLLQKIEQKTLSADIDCLCELHAFVAAGEDLEWGNLRGEGAEKNYTPGVRLIKGRFIGPIPTAEPENIRAEMLMALTNFLNSEKQAEDGVRLFCALSLIQPFFGANKRTIFLFVNAVLADEGISPLVLPLDNLAGFAEAFSEIFAGNQTPMTALLLEEYKKAYLTLNVAKEKLE